MPSPPLPPYDIIIFFVVWIITGICWIMSLLSRSKWGCCCTCGEINDQGCLFHVCGPIATTNNNENNKIHENNSLGNNNNTNTNNNVVAVESTTTGEEMRRSQQPHHAITLLEEQTGETKQQYGGANDTTNKNSNVPSSSTPGGSQQQEEQTTQQIIIRIIIGIISTFVIAFIISMIIMAILAGAGFLSMLLFSPAAASTCKSSCTYTTKNGLNDWVEESCCTYSPTFAAGIEKHDLFLKSRDNSTNSMSSFVLNGWILINRTKHWSASPTEKPAIIFYNHGSGSNIAAGYRKPRYEFLLSSGNCIVVTYDYAGYGKSTGTAGSVTVMSSANIVAHWIEQHLSPKTDMSSVSFSSTATAAGTVIPLGASLTDPTVIGIRTNSAGADLSRVIIACRSLGGAVCTEIAEQSTIKPKAMILQSTFSDLPQLAHYYFPMLSFCWNSYYGMYNKYKPVANVEGLNYCMYHAHSKEDEWVPFSQGLEINDVAKKTWNSVCSQFVVVPDAIHTQPLTNLERTTLFSFLVSSSVRN